MTHSLSFSHLLLILKEQLFQLTFLRKSSPFGGFSSLSSEQGLWMLLWLSLIAVHVWQGTDAKTISTWRVTSPSSSLLRCSPGLCIRYEKLCSWCIYELIIVTQQSNHQVLYLRKNVTEVFLAVASSGLWSASGWVWNASHPRAKSRDSFLIMRPGEWHIHIHKHIWSQILINF